MAPRRTTSGLALSATAALLVSAVSTAALSSSASAAPGDAPAAVTVDASTNVPGDPGSPGEAQQGSVQVLAADGTSVGAGQVVTLSVDHGFFTTGAERGPAVDGQPAGNLVRSGTTISVTTGAGGTASFQVGMERDAGFDDDGAVTAVVTATAGTVTGQDSAAWLSDVPLNPSVALVLSPTSVQEAPVAPTVAFDRTYYDVVVRDQFGNPVAGAPIDLYPAVELDYSDAFVESDLALDGDVWVEAEVGGNFLLEASWLDAPTYRFPATGSPTRGSADADASTTVAYYQASFAGSSYSLTPSAPGESPVGTTITQTVTVTDQLGRPVRGLDVAFFRFGPEVTGGDQKATRETNGLGQASYSFVGTGAGVAKTTAVVSDGTRSRTLVNEVGFKHVTTVSATAAKKLVKSKAKGKKAVKVEVDPAGADVLRVRSQEVAEGATVTVFRVRGTSRKAVGRNAELDASGSATVVVKDKNKKKRTTYVVVVRPSTTVFGSTSAPVRVR